MGDGAWGSRCVAQPWLLGHGWAAPPYRDVWGRRSPVVDLGILGHDQMKSLDVRSHRIFIQRLRLDRALIVSVSLDFDRTVEGERGRVARLDLI